MIFKRSTPKRPYKRYESYREQLRRDFRYRCAYCTRQEGHNGGEANFCIDHFRPKDGPRGRPDLIAAYINLYWCCRECNDYKADIWPSDTEERNGLRFIDPCTPHDDHDLHWTVQADGSLECLTTAGAYTVNILTLWRPELQHWRRHMVTFQAETEDIEMQLSAELAPEDYAALTRRLEEVRRQIEPPIFNRPRVKKKRLPDIVLPQDPFA